MELKVKYGKKWPSLPATFHSDKKSQLFKQIQNVLIPAGSPLKSRGFSYGAKDAVGPQHANIKE